MSRDTRVTLLESVLAFLGALGLAYLADLLRR